MLTFQHRQEKNDRRHREANTVTCRSLRADILTLPAITSSTSMILQSQATPSSADAGQGILFVKNTNPTTLGFMNDNGDETILGASITPNLSGVLTAGNDADGLSAVGFSKINFASASGVKIGTQTNDATTANSNAIAIGALANASTDAIAIGSGGGTLGPLASGTGSIAIGSLSNTTVSDYQTRALGSASIAIGGGVKGAIARSTRSIACGYAADANGYASIAIGYQAKTHTSLTPASRSICIGPESNVSCSYGIALGNVALIDSPNSKYGIAIGCHAHIVANAAQAICIGSSIAAASSARCYGTNSIAIGSSDSATTKAARAYGQSSIAIGSNSGSNRGALASGTAAIAIGTKSYAAAYCIALGLDANATGASNDNVAISVGGTPNKFTTSFATSGSAGALATYMIVKVAGTTYKIPLHAN